MVPQTTWKLDARECRPPHTDAGKTIKYDLFILAFTTKAKRYPAVQSIHDAGVTSTDRNVRNRNG